MPEPEQPEIASREEVLRMLTEKARQGQTGAMIALERALRAKAKENEPASSAFDELDRLLRD
jgi:hypothetical protein